MIIDVYNQQLSILKELGCNVPDNYICPFCLCPSNDKNPPSMEDAPQEALGGKKIALTCKGCNNKYGGLVDCHLVNYITDSEDKKMPDGLDRPFSFIDPTMFGDDGPKPPIMNTLSSITKA